MTKAAKNSTAANFAKQYKKPKRVCKSCSHPKVSEDIRMVMELVASGESDVSWSALYQWLVGNYEDYQISETAFRHHLRNHERNRYQKCQEKYGTKESG